MPLKIKDLFIYFVLFDIVWHISLGTTNTSPFSYFVGIFKSWTSFTLNITTTLSFLLFSLSAYYFLWFYRKKEITAFLIILLCIPIIILIRYSLEEFICPLLFGFQNYNPNTSLPFYFMDNKYFSIPYTAFGIVFYFIQSNRFKEKLNSELELQNRNAELVYLKSQIDPHFLFNNLNSIYSLIYHRSDKALKAVEQLSALLRYTLYEKSHHVPLTAEIDYLTNYIELQKLRLDNDIRLNVTIDNKNTNTVIAPLLLIPIVENAFKYGDLKDNENPLTIRLINTNTECSFMVENKISLHANDTSKGIGLSNLKRRLELIYPNSYSFNIEESHTSYKATLKIKW